MYTGHFGLDDGPFHGKAEGQEVYIGPQQAAVIARLRKVLAIADTAVAVSGPVGVGKTTLVRRALTELAGSRIVVPVDRMRLEPDEVLDLLLSRFDVARPPKGTIQRVAAFRRLLHERLANDIRVFIVVEDAERIGVDALLELEALTATDSGESTGANIVLLGGGELSALLAKPALARLRQRIRLRQPVAPFDEAEVEGYMRHCLESAGGVLEQIFEPGTARIAYRYSGGIARVVDVLCESALVAAAEAGLVTILPEFLQEVADNCGLEPQVPETEAHAGETANEAAEQAEFAGDVSGAEPCVEAPPHTAPFVVPPKLALVEPLPAAGGATLPGEAGALPEWQASRPESGTPADSAEIPTLSNSMRVAVLPVRPMEERPRSAADVDRDELSAEAEEYLAGEVPPIECNENDTGEAAAHDGVRTPALPESESRREPEPALPVDPVAEPAAEEVGEPQLPRPAPAAVATPAGEHAEQDLPVAGPADTAPAAERAADDDRAAKAPAGVPLSLVRDEAPAPQIVAERSDEEVTTEALALCFDEALTLAPDAATDVFVDSGKRDAVEAGGPELDALQAAIQAANAWQASETEGVTDPAPPARLPAADLPEFTLDAALAQEKPASMDLDRWADELSRAKGLEDISDILAETIFGNEEMEAIGAGIRARKAGERPAAGEAARPAAAPRPAAVAPRSGATQGTIPRRPVADRSGAPAASRPPPKAPPRPAAGNGINMTMSQRIEMVNSLKGRKPLKPMPGMQVAEIVLAEQPDEPPHSGGDRPQPIEAQIDTAITQSRKVLSEADLARLAASDGHDDDKGRRGLFGFFRRSSKP